jgi:protein involved in polysaccharide export with SLBB domain
VIVACSWVVLLWGLTPPLWAQTDANEFPGLRAANDQPTLRRVTAVQAAQPLGQTSSPKALEGSSVDDPALRSARQRTVSRQANTSTASSAPPKTVPASPWTPQASGSPLHVPLRLENALSDTEESSKTDTAAPLKPLDHWSQIESDWQWLQQKNQAQGINPSVNDGTPPFSRPALGPHDVLEPTPHFTGKATATSSPYLLGPGDILSMSVYNQEDLAQASIKVRADGYATFNLVGDIFVAGKSMEDLAKELELALSEFMVRPKVSVRLDANRPGTVYVAGAVFRPGMYQIVGDPALTRFQQTVIDTRYDFRLSTALANAGGVMANADIGHVQIRRADTGQVDLLDLWPMIRTGESKSDYFLQPGDGVFIPSLPNLALSDDDYHLLMRSIIAPRSVPIRVIGWVNKQGVVQIDGISPYVTTAISLAEGFQPTAMRNLVVIGRKVDDEHTTLIKVDPRKHDLLLRPNDVVYIPEQKIFKGGRHMANLAQYISPYLSGTSAVNTTLDIVDPSRAFDSGN